MVVSLVYFLVQAIIYFAKQGDTSGSKQMSKGVLAVVIIFGSVVGFLMLLLLGFGIFHLSLKIR